MSPRFSFWLPLQDSDGNSPLHTLCDQKDIKTATSILRSNGKLLVNMASQMPAIEELFFSQEEKDVGDLVEAIALSRHRKEILDKILRREHLLFRLLEEDKPEILSIVLKKLTDSDQEEYVNLVRNKHDGNTVLHLATIDKKDLKSASLLLEAGARFSTNAKGLTPPIEDFFTEEIEDEITTALVDGLVKRVEANQMDKKQALKLLVPDDKRRKVLFQLAAGSKWKTIAEWADEEWGEKKSYWEDKKFSFSQIIPRLADLELEKMVEVAKEGHWEKEEVHALLCEEDEEGVVILSRLQLNSQQEVAAWNQKTTAQIAHKMSPEFLQWLILEANEGRWNGEDLGAAFCELDANRNLKLATVDEELQKQLAVLNKTKTCLSVSLLGSRMQQWLYQEAHEGRWNQDEVSRVLEEVKTEGGTVITARVKQIGMQAFLVVSSMYFLQ